MEYWNLEKQIDPFIIGILVADGYVRAKDLGGGIDMCDEPNVALVASRFNAPYHMRARKKNHKDTWRDQYIASWSSGQPGLRMRKPQFAWAELVDTGIMRPNKKYQGMNAEVIAHWQRSARMAFHAGFLEGDGCVRKASLGCVQATIENHSCMLSYHELFRVDTLATGRINNRGHVISNICAKKNHKIFLSEVGDLVKYSSKLQKLTNLLS